MRILLMSWEYPPLVVGGLGRHVEALARRLAASGHDVRVVTRGEGATITDETRDGVCIRRAAVDPIAIDFTTETLLAWTQASEHSLVRATLPWLRRWRPDVVHAHDWLVAQSAITVAEVTGAPLVTTVHATEAGRHQGWLPRPLNLAIHSVERWLVHRSQAVITCSHAMHEEATRLFEVDAEHVSVVPNGVDAARWRAGAAARAAARARHTGDPSPRATPSSAGGPPMIVFAGRLVHEKGVQTLLDAVRPLRAIHPGLRLVVAGTGVYEAALHARARRLRIARSIDWLGFVAEDEVAALLGAADVVVVPSLYEPFGIVALEAAAAHTPLVVAETGGLLDLVTDGVATASFAPKDVDGLVAAIASVLADPAAARRGTKRANRVIRRDYTWQAVAEHTVGVYERARTHSSWRPG